MFYTYNEKYKKKKRVTELSSSKKKTRKNYVKDNKKNWKNNL